MGLASAAGYVDAIGFIATQGFFVSFMSGNSTRLGVGLSDRAGIALTAMGLILSFFAGAVIATILNRRSSGGGARTLLALVALMIASAAILIPGGFPNTGLALMAAAMGGVNLVHERDGEVRFGVSYMTGALVKAGQALGNRLAGDTRADPVPYLLLWAGLVAGAALGALAYPVVGERALWLAAAAIAILAMIENIDRASLVD
jgi:uncharacterized membrane protein YoaK (UPF0700 family)